MFDRTEDVMNTTYTLDILWTGERFEVTVPELGVSAWGVTYQEAIENGLQAIDAARLAALQSAKKPRRVRVPRSVA